MADETVQQKTDWSRVDALDDLELQSNYVETFIHMLGDLLEGGDEIPELDINDPASRTQRMYACLESVKERMRAIKLISTDMRTQHYQSGRA